MRCVAEMDFKVMSKILEKDYTLEISLINFFTELVWLFGIYSLVTFLICQLTTDKLSGLGKYKEFLKIDH